MKNNKEFSDFIYQFFWSFKRMDNAGYNYEILNSLYLGKKKSNNPEHFNKPIIIILVSIIECCIYDFVKRVNQHRSEKIPNMHFEFIQSTREKQLDKFEPLIAHIKKFDLLKEENNERLYENLDLLRKIRNRVHIQNSNSLIDNDEQPIWNQKRLNLAETVFERILGFLSTDYPRPGRDKISLKDIALPWKDN